jgi:hypothetical protein
MTDIDPGERWEQGIDHDPRSKALFKSIRQLDLQYGDLFCFKAGGDGDNGEWLMYLLDIHHARQDAAAMQNSTPDTEMKLHVTNERDGLAARLVDMDELVKMHSRDTPFTHYEMVLLREQNALMHAYVGVLNKRLECMQNYPAAPVETDPPATVENSPVPAGKTEPNSSADSNLIVDSPVTTGKAPS